MSAATVSIAGNDTTVTVKLKDDTNVGDVVAAAIAELNLGAGVADRLNLVKNGEDADPADPVTEGDVVSAAPAVTNG